MCFFGNDTSKGVICEYYYHPELSLKTFLKIFSCESYLVFTPNVIVLRMSNKHNENGMFDNRYGIRIQNLPND